MSCNSCAISFSFFRKEKGCPSCGFSYCTKCLKYKKYLEKCKKDVLVCSKCFKAQGSSIEPKLVAAPDAYHSLPEEKNTSQRTMVPSDPMDQEIQQRLNNLKEGHSNQPTTSTDEQIAARLQKIKHAPNVSDAELQSRLARLRDIPVTAYDKPVLFLPDKRTEQEQADDLLKQYEEKHKIDKTYSDELDDIFKDVESRLTNLKDNNLARKTNETKASESSDEDETVNKIIEKLKIESKLNEDEDICKPTNDELPFCEICNEDATLRCLGCSYLFCKRCFMEHKDDDDGCDQFEPYPKKL